MNERRRRWVCGALVCLAACGVYAVWADDPGELPIVPPAMTVRAEPVSEEQARASEVAEPYAHLGDERIVDYFVQLLPEPNGDLMVIERITIVCRGDKVKRGIYLGIGNKKKYELIDVKRNGEPAFCRIEDESDKSPRLSILQDDVYLTQGRYLYTIRYRIKEEISISKHTRKFRWKPVGPWNMPIEHATLMVHLAEEQRDQIVDGWAYLVKKKSRQVVLKPQRLPGGPLWFETERPLEPEDSMYVFLEWWPRGPRQ